MAVGEHIHIVAEPSYVKMTIVEVNSGATFLMQRIDGLELKQWNVVYVQYF